MKDMERPLFIKWNECNEVGIPLIDEQHKGIVSIINTLFYLMGAGTDNKILYSCVSDTMKNYSRIHFITEEKILETSEYREIEEHKNLHRNLSHEIECIEFRCINDNDASQMLHFLKNWWLEHINVQDQRFAQHLRMFKTQTSSKR